MCALLACGAVLSTSSGHAAEHPVTTTQPRQSCAEAGHWLALDGKQAQPATNASVIGAAAAREVVLLGEEHDNEDHHRWQFQVLAALHAQRPDLVIGFEMFPRRLQPVLDRWVTGQLTAKEFLSQAEWESVWGQPAALYMPLFDFARINRIPMLALNIDQKLTRAITEKGWDGVPAGEREGVGHAAPALPAYRDFLFEIHREHPTKHDARPGKPSKSDPAFRNFVDAQLAWDRAMAEALVQRLNGKSSNKPLLVGIMGSGHLRFGYGVPHQLRDLGVRSLSTLLPGPAGSDCRPMSPAFADAVFAIEEKPALPVEPPRLGIQLENASGTIRIVAVTAASLAEKTGLQAGDRLLELAGRPVEKITALIAAVRRQPPGTWLPLRIQRGEASLELVVHFPPAP
jgi:uncharacterized iron-regulated protein